MTYQGQLNEMASDIRKVDPNHTMGAGRLAEALMGLGWTKKNFEVWIDLTGRDDSRTDPGNPVHS